MAAVRPPRPGLRTPSISTHEQTTAPNQPKLRNSCHACASCKLKCSQEKPTCSRCAKRGLTCEYVAAKRGGRKPNSRSSRGNRDSDIDVSNSAIHTDHSTHLPSQTNWYAASSSSIGTEPLRSPGVMPRSPAANVPGPSGRLQDLFGPIDVPLSSTSTDTGTDLHNLFTSRIPFSEEVSDVNIFGTADFFPVGIESSSNGSENLSETFPVFEDAISELFAHSVPSSTPKSSTTPSKEVHKYQEIRTTETPCSCLVQALVSMKQLLPSSSNACMTWATQAVNEANASPSVQAVIARNEATIEAVSAMLKCSCSQDGYLLAIMSLIIFKVLGWYAAVAHKTPNLQGAHTYRSRQSSPAEQVLQNTNLVGSYCLDGADSARMAAQLVLNELHRVRHLVDHLSSKLKLHAAKKGTGGGTGMPEGLDFDNEMALPLSAVMYDQLDADLRKRLKALSWEMVDRLRRL